MKTDDAQEHCVVADTWCKCFLIFPVNNKKYYKTSSFLRCSFTKIKNCFISDILNQHVEFQVKAD